MGSTDDNRQGDDEALKRRLDALTKALDVKRQDTEEAALSAREGADSGTGKAMGVGFRVASELASAIAVGGLLGWQIDKWLGTDPWCLLVFLMLGIAAGFWNVYKLAVRPSGGTLPPKH